MMKPMILLAADAPNVYTATRLYAQMGLSVLPCTGKKPALQQWSHLQKRIAEPRTIDLWHSTGLLQNVGIICGDVSEGTVVIDLDGNAAVDAFSATFPELLDTYSVLSGSGEGMHLYYSARIVPPTTRVTGLSIGNIELRSNGSYVVAPPSVHPETKQKYAAIRKQSLMFVPDMHEVVNWIKSLIREKHGGNMPPPSNASTDKVIKATNYARAALEGECRDVRLAIRGGQNNRLYAAALKLGSLIAAGWIDRATVESALLDAADELNMRDGIRASEKTIASGIEQGLQSSRRSWKEKA